MIGDDQRLYSADSRYDGNSYNSGSYNNDNGINENTVHNDNNFKEAVATKIFKNIRKIDLIIIMITTMMIIAKTIINC